MLKFICYPKCTTCQKARKWLDENNIEYEFRDIKTENPSLGELTEWYKLSGLPLRKFFNTSGMQYRALELKDKLGGSAMELDFSTGSAPVAAPAGNAAMANAALQELGYSAAEINAALKGADPNATTEELIRYALRAMVMKS